MKMPQAGIDKIKEAISIRESITAMYKRYEKLSEIVQMVSGCKHGDFKRSVDAIHYLGGGWPSANSKGRMEAMLDNFVGMYRVMKIAGMGHLVEEHLGKLGMTVTLTDEIPEYVFTEADKNFLLNSYGAETFNLNMNSLSDLMHSAIMEGDVMQTFICQNADTIKDDLKPGAMTDFGVELEEYNRIHDIMKLDTDKAHKSKILNDQSIANYREAIKLIRK